MMYWLVKEAMCSSTASRLRPALRSKRCSRLVLGIPIKQTEKNCNEPPERCLVETRYSPPKMGRAAKIPRGQATPGVGEI